MQKKKAEIILIVFSVVSLILLYLSSDLEYKKITDLNGCDGKVKLAITLEKTFYSKKKNYFGKSGNFIVFLNKYKYLSKGDQILVFGRANKKNNTCFIFPDKVVLLDVKT